MSDASILSGSNQQLVTASTLVRQFGLWQERATRAPVYILHRGRPRLVLIATELLESSLASQSSPRTDDSQSALIEALPFPALLLDRDLRVVAASRRARLVLGDAATPAPAPFGASLDQEASALARALARVVVSGEAESVEIVAPRDGRRRLALSLEPLSDGVLVLILDATAADELREARAVQSAAALADRANGKVASVRVNPRGYLVDSAPALAAMTGLAEHSLTQSRFPALFDVGTRVAVGEAIERLFDGVMPIALDARLLVNRGDPLPVRLGFAAIRRGAAAIEGASVTLVSNDDPAGQV